MEDRFDDAKDRAGEAAGDAKDRAGDMFNKDQEDREDDEQGGLLDNAKEKARDAVSKMRDRQGE